MKKIITILVIAVLVTAGYFGYDTVMDKNITSSSHWTETGTSEFTVNLPDSMKSSSKLYTVSTGQEQIAYYSNSKACFSVAKLPYSVNENLKNIDIESYFGNFKINDEKINIKPINDGYYYSRQTELSGIFKDTKKVFKMEGMFKGDNAIYSVVIQCRERDRKDYEDSMTEWLESFKLK